MSDEADRTAEVFKDYAPQMRGAIVKLKLVKSGNLILSPLSNDTYFKIEYTIGHMIMAEGLRSGERNYYKVSDLEIVSPLELAKMRIKNA